MRIGELAKATETSLQTLRFYERRGLLGKTKRLNSGYRDFSPDMVQVIRYIRQAQELGFTLNEIKEFLTLRKQEGSNSIEVRELTNSKLKNIESKIKSLEQMRDELKHVLKTCDCSDKVRCPTLEALDFKADL